MIIDGPDSETEVALGSINDHRVRIIALSQQGGPARARNAGVRACRGRWVAFLDDDDTWQPEKLARQLEAAEGTPVTHPVVCCRAVTRTPSGDFIWPRRLPRPGEDIAEYMFCRKSIFAGEAFIHTSSLMTTRALLDQVPFRDDLTIPFEDADWHIRVSERADTALLMVKEPLCVYYHELFASFSRTRDLWRQSLNWVHEMRPRISRRAYAGFCLVTISGPPAAARDWRAFGVLLYEGCRYGRPTIVEVSIYAAMWVLPLKFRRWVRTLLFKL